MNSRERVIASLNHKQPDYLPLDLGGCGQTGMSASTLYKLRKEYGLDEHPILISEPYQLLGEIENDLLEKIGADVVPLWNRDNLLGISNFNLTKHWNMSDGIPVLMSENFEYDVDDRGYTFVYPGGDRSVAPSLKMTKDGFFFDNIERAPEYDEDNLTPLEDFKDAFTLRNEIDCEHWEKQSRSKYENSEYAIMGMLGGMGLGDAAEIPGPFVKHPSGIRSVSGWLEAHILYPEYVSAVYEMQTEMALKNLELYRESIGDRIQSIWLSGTDFGSQNAPMQSVNSFRTLYKPYYRKVNDWIHTNTSWKTFYHTCGAVSEFIPDFIDMGMDILNPVQCSAAGMDAGMLKEKFGDNIVFWGGGVDTQHTLPTGTPKEVYDEVIKRCEIFSPNGGYVFAAIHNVVAKVPPKNLVAMFEAVNDFRRR